MEWKTFITTPGGIRFSSADLAYRNVLKVKRDGIGYDIIDTAPPAPARQVCYIPGLGQLIFDITNKFSPGEKIYVLYD